MARTCELPQGSLLTSPFSPPVSPFSQFPSDFGFPSFRVSRHFTTRGEMCGLEASERLKDVSLGVVRFDEPGLKIIRFVSVVPKQQLKCDRILLLEAD